MKAQYKIKKKSNNPAEVLFEKSGFTQELTLGDLDYNISYNQKSRKEVEAQVNLEKAKIKNVLETNPEVEKMSKKHRIAAYIYERSNSIIEVGEQKLKQLDEAIQADKREMADISKQTGIVLIKINDVVQTKPLNEILKDGK